MQINKYRNKRGRMFDVEKEVLNIIDQIKTYFSASAHKDAVAVIGISGGKDSSVCATLLVKALGKDRVIGVKMPQGNQYDIDIANEVIELLGIKSYEVNIGAACDTLYAALEPSVDIENQVLKSNTPARMRMATLYAIAGTCHGRVINTCNLSENYVGYATKFGDAAGDFSILSEFTVTEVRHIGDYLGLPEHIVWKTPEDGLSGMSDEENLGFSYDTLDQYLRMDIYPSVDVLAIIREKESRNRHKLDPMPGVGYNGSVCSGYYF